MEQNYRHDFQNFVITTVKNGILFIIVVYLRNGSEMKYLFTANFEYFSKTYLSMLWVWRRHKAQQIDYF